MDEAKMARTESAFREVNEAIAKTAERFEATEADFVCECADPDCAHRITAELDGHFELSLEVPETLDALRLTFAEALHRAAAKGRVALLIDGLNQLDDVDGALELAWLPSAILSRTKCSES